MNRKRQQDADVISRIVCYAQQEAVFDGDLAYALPVAVNLPAGGLQGQPSAISVLLLSMWNRYTTSGPRTARQPIPVRTMPSASAKPGYDR